MAWNRETERHSTWLVAAALNTIIIRYLVFGKHVPYPMVMLAVHLTGVLLFRGVEASLWPTKCTATIWPKSSNHLSHLATHVAAKTAALVCTYGALRAVPTLSTCLIVLSLDWPCGTTFLLSHRLMVHQRCSRLATVIYIITFFACLVTIVLLDPRLYPQGIQVLTLAAVASWLVPITTPPSAGPIDLSAQESPDGDIRFLADSLTLISALAIALLLFVTFELPNIMQYVPPVPLSLTVLSAVSGATTLHLTGHPFRYTTRIGAAVGCSNASINPQSHECARLLMIGIVIGLWATTESMASLVTMQVCPWLLAVYITVIFCTGRKTKALETMTRKRESGSGISTTANVSLLPMSARIHHQPSKARQQQWTWTHVLFTITAAAAVVNLIIVKSSFIADGITSAESTLLHSNRRQSLDVVIVRCKEPVEGIVNFLRTFSQLPNVRSRDLRIIVYDKGSGRRVTEARNESQVNEDSFTSTPDFLTYLQVIPLPNTGREAATYLYHIADRWNDLADHTIFLQAQPHDVRGLQRRIEDYLTPATGFLSLSYPENTCKSCTTCHDLSGWHEDTQVLEPLFNAANNATGRTCGDLVLTYRGQFVVSAQRIRKSERDMYIGLRDWLIASQELTTGAEAADLGQFKDLKIAHNAGYTMERMWGSLFHCFNRDIPAKCPSLLSGMLRRPEDVGWCQCLDTA